MEDNLIESTTPTTQEAPPEPSPLELAQELQVKLTQGMPTDTEMRTGAPRVVQRHLDWQKRNKRDIERYQDLRKTVPNLPSIESLRLP